MTMDNRHRLSRGLELLASGLGPFVDTRMTAVAPDDRDWIQALAARDRPRYGAQRQHSLSDARFLLRVLTEEWRAFRDQLSRTEQSFASELRETGNRWAHGESFSADDTFRALDTMERLLTAIGASRQAADVCRLRLGRQPTAAVEVGTSPADPLVPQPGPAVVPPSGRTPQSWARVARSDVVRAIEQ